MSIANANRLDSMQISPPYVTPSDKSCPRRSAWSTARTTPHLLGASEEISLARRIGRGDAQAREMLIACNLGLVNSLARRFAAPGIETADLFQEGVIGLMQAVERFDPSHGCRFSTYATWWIRRAISRAVLTESNIVRVPYHVADEMRQILRASDLLRHTLEREPTLDEVAAALGKPVDRVAFLKRLQEEPFLLDTADINRETLLRDQLPGSSRDDGGGMASRLVRREEIERLLSRLNGRQQTVLRLRYGLDGCAPWTADEVARHLRISIDNARQIERRALRKLRNTSGENPEHLNRGHTAPKTDSF